ncbi:MAG: DUF3326 domain-containing protein [Bacteroidetes bacterium]|nr:DUF3326 domain-containing protein [Bacteroidota bacterium]
MRLTEKEFKVPYSENSSNLIEHFANAVKVNIESTEFPTRFVVTKSDGQNYHCELGLIQGLKDKKQHELGSIFDFKKRDYENTDKFNTVLLVPTGIGSEIGGHDGDAGPVAKLLASVSDILITHPNVVNASDINELPQNGLYVEGSVISRFLMGTIGLQKVRNNRVLVIIENHKDESFTNAAINAVNAARATYGFNCPQIVVLNPTAKLKSVYTSSGCAVGIVENYNSVVDVLEEHKNEYDAVAITSIIDVPRSFHWDYFSLEGELVNPWGGVEAILTHAVSLMYNIPSAHSPMFESQEISNIDPGIVDPRMAAEAISFTFLNSILKGLQRSPRIITNQDLFTNDNILTSSDISCLVIPDKCIGLPTLAALEHGITVIAVKENKNIMENDLTKLPWAKDQLYIVDNYWEAAGLISAIRSGITPESVRRPLSKANVSDRNYVENFVEQKNRANTSEK